MDNHKDNRYAQRLISYWRTFSKVVLATEFDGVIKADKFNDQAQCNKYIAILKLAKEIGAYIVVFTASDEDRYDEIKRFCESHGLGIDTINVNPISLPYGQRNKIQANWFLESHSALDTAFDILEFACYTRRSELHSPSIQTVEF